MNLLDPITHPEQLESGHRYKIAYSIPYVKAKSGFMTGDFEDVFTEFSADKFGFFLYFFEQPKVDWLHITKITRAE